MSMISEQVKELREIATNWNPNIPINPVSVVLNKAADTIESLSAKLQAAERERSAADCGGGWILCKDRLPEEEGVYLVTKPNFGNWVVDTMHFCRGSFTDKYVTAWQPLPEPYH